MPTAALIALSLSVLMHAAWNLLARAAPLNTQFLWWALSGYLLLVGPWSLYFLLTGATWDVHLVLLMAVTAVAESGYFLALGAAYRHGPVALVYPIARSSPLLIAVWGALLFGEQLSLMGWLGIFASVIGLLALGATARHRDARRAVPWAVLAALCTSVYSTSNKLAVVSLPGYATQLGYVTVALAAAWVTLTLESRARTGKCIPPQMPPVAKWLPAGLFIGNAYGLVIYAMQFIPAAFAVAFTNAGIVIGGVLSITVYREREHWPLRLGAMVVICIGLFLLAMAW